MANGFFSSEKNQELRRTESTDATSGVKIENASYTMNLWKKLKDISQKQIQIML